MNSPKISEIRRRGALPPDIHSAFLDWVDRNYHGRYAQEIIDQFVQTGTYPEEFLEEWRKL